MTRGGRNLLLLGIGSATIALITTGASLIIYHNSGDIYLDRSRPGFLPEKEETKEEEKDTEYVFPENGEFTKEAAKEYLENFKDNTTYLEKLEDPFSESPLSNESLGIAPDNPTDNSPEP